MTQQDYNIKIAEFILAKCKGEESKNFRFQQLLFTLNITEFSDEVKKFIKEASEAGIQQVIGTASKKKYVEIILKRYKLYQYFSHIVSGDDVKRGKPDPETWLQCAKLLNLPPNKIIVIEDGIAGIKAAKKAGMPNILISSQKTRKANICIQNFKQLSISDLKTLKLTP